MNTLPSKLLKRTPGQPYSIHQDFVYIHWAQLQLTFGVFFFLVFDLHLGNLLDRLLHFFLSSL